jgi:hypothetical protein
MGAPPFPARSPGAFDRGRYDGPRRRDGVAAADDPEGEDGAAWFQRRGIHGQRARATIGGRRLARAAQRQRATGGAIRRASCASLRRTGRAAGSALPVTQGLNPRLVAWLEQRGRQDGDGRRTATLRRHDAETPPRRHLPLWCAELREMGGPTFLLWRSSIGARHWSSCERLGVTTISEQKPVSPSKTFDPDARRPRKPYT